MTRRALQTSASRSCSVPERRPAGRHTSGGLLLPVLQRVRRSCDGARQLVRVGDTNGSANVGNARTDSDILAKAISWRCAQSSPSAGTSCQQQLQSDPAPRRLPLHTILDSDCYRSV